MDAYHGRPASELACVPHCLGGHEDGYSELQVKLLSYGHVSSCLTKHANAGKCHPETTPTTPPGRANRVRVPYRDLNSTGCCQRSKRPKEIRELGSFHFLHTVGFCLSPVGSHHGTLNTHPVTEAKGHRVEHGQWLLAGAHPPPPAPEQPQLQLSRTPSENEFSGPNGF